jgi:hypothetical protein
VVGWLVGWLIDDERDRERERERRYKSAKWCAGGCVVSRLIGLVGWLELRERAHMCCNQSSSSCSGAIKAERP